MSLIVLNNVSKTYPLKSGQVDALRDLMLEVDKAEFVAVSGPSGSGKTTLFNLVACLDRPTSGTVTVTGVDTRQLTPSQAAELRQRNFGFVFQSFNLIPVLTAFENIEVPLLITSHGRSERKRRVHEIAERLDIGRLLHHRPDELSGGQKQRVAIARALVNRPKIIIADEPTANLDSTSGQLVLDLAKELVAQFHVTFLFSSHDSAMVQQASRVLQLRDGRDVTPPQKDQQ